MTSKFDQPEPKAGAPVTESPESPNVPSEAPRSAAPVAETPEFPAVPPQAPEEPKKDAERESEPEPEVTLEESKAPEVEAGVLVGGLLGDVQTGGTNPLITHSTYNNPDFQNNPYVFTALDTGVGSAPADRAVTRTPTTWPIVDTPAIDGSVNTTPATRPSVFEPPSTVVTIAPGGN